MSRGVQGRIVGSRRGMRAKRVFDVAVAAPLLILLAPLFALVAVAVRLAMDPGSVLLRQPRLGYRGRPFVLYKFRTMTEARDTDGALLTDDDRLTRFGRLLRRTSVDELPALVNVLRGDMSLVGPRPLLVDYRDLYSPDEWRRHDMPAGITGPVQVSGRNALSWAEKFRLDVWYVDHWSFWLDIRILALTAWKVATGAGVSPEGRATVPRFGGARGRLDV